MKFTIIFSAFFLLVSQNVNAQDLDVCTDDQIDSIIDQFGCFPETDFDDGDGDGEGEGDSFAVDSIFTFLFENCGCDGETEPDPTYQGQCKKILGKNSKTKKPNLPPILVGLEAMELITHEDAVDIKALAKECPKF